jgi:DNA mismatch repair protein MutS
VAKMAGMPPALIERANEILKLLEKKHEDQPEGSTQHKLTDQVKQIATQKVQLSIFDAHSETFDDIRKMLNDIDINRLTPVEALMKLNEIKGLVK